MVPFLREGMVDKVDRFYASRGRRPPEGNSANSPSVITKMLTQPISHKSSRPFHHIILMH